MVAKRHAKKPNGWKGESRRHSLARKGVNTVLPDGRKLAVNKFVAGGQTERFSGRATTIFTDDDGWVQGIYHSTAVVKYHPKRGRVELDSGGWMTVTTKARMNQFSHQYGLGYEVFQRDFDWWVRLPGGEVVDFKDGMQFSV